MTINLKLAKNLTLSQKIIGGFSAVGFLFLLVIGVSLYSAHNSSTMVSTITEKIQPAVLLSGDLRESVEAASASMGFYLLSKEEQHKNNYVSQLEDIKKDVQLLSELEVIKDDETSLNLMSEITAGLEKFYTFQDKVFQYAENDAENYPALPYGAVNINPLSQQLLQIVSMMILSEEEEDATAKRKKLLKELGELRYVTSAIMGGIRAYLAFRNPAAVDEVNLYTEQLDTVLQRVRGFSDDLTFEQEEGIEEFAEILGRFQANFKIMYDMHRSEKWRMDSFMLRTEISPLIDEILVVTGKLVDRQSKRANTLAEKMVVEATAINSMFIGLAILAVILIAVIVYVIYQFSIKPIRKTVRALENISSGEGDLTRRLDVNGKDEVGQLAVAFNQFVSRIQTLISQSANVAENMSEGVSQLEVVSKKSSDGAKTQQDETQLVSRSVDELLNASNSVSISASEAATSAENAKISANDGQQTLTQAMDAFTSLEGEVGNASQVISELEASSENIGGMLDVIKAIAEQTNLLALNAAIEAARAGEQGRGFAVVADEVRTLASRTQESTVEIEELVTQFQSSAKGASSAMDSGKDKAREGVEFAQSVSTALGQIAQSINAIADMNSDIASQADSQKDISSEIQQNVGTLMSVGEQSAQGAKETLDTADKLAGFRDELQGLMKQFKV